LITLFPCKALRVALIDKRGGQPANISVLAQNESIALKLQSDVNIQPEMSRSPLELHRIPDLDLTMLANMTTPFSCQNLSKPEKSDYDYIERKKYF